MQFKEDTHFTVNDLIQFIHKSVLIMLFVFGVSLAFTAFAAKPAIQVVAPQA
jgi:hypothetical protein